jgi:hypothetical protein
VSADPKWAACERLASHVVELRLAQLPDATGHHRRAAANALGAGFVESCRDGLEAEQVTCALDAHDDDELVACLDLAIEPEGGV